MCAAPSDPELHAAGDAIRPFSFAAVPSIHMEWGCTDRLGEMLAEWRPERNILIVTDSGLNGSALLGKALNSLDKSNFRVTVFDGVVADPPEAILHACVAAARNARVDCVLGLGGGSSMDVAKLAAILLRSDQSLASMYGIGNVIGERVPLVQVPTTAGTGSEATNISILTTGETTKMGVVAPQLYADRVILDASLTIGLPPLHTAATGIDAMVHAIEAYTSRHKKNPVSDALAREALRLLARHLVPACRNGADRNAREAMLLGANLAGQAFTNAPVAAVHALAYPLGGHFHIPHGLSNALMLAPVLKFNMAAAAPLYAELCDILCPPGSADPYERASQFVAQMDWLMDASGAPRRLRDAGVPEDSLAMLAADAMKQTRLLANNPVEVGEADALALYRAAW